MTVSWASLMAELEQCHRCALRDGCQRVVPGEGDPNADLMLIGEGPGADEDRLGRPFVGRAGELLTRMLAAIDLRRDQVYICNVVKCRPPRNRAPLPEEMDACKGYLRSQFALVQPRVLVLLGATAGKAVLGDSFRVTRDRGAWVERRGVWIMPTFHPAALLRDESLKRPTWEDLKAVRRRLDELAGPPEA